MPTGYTQPIEKGITFKQYAMNCAREFGAFVSIRDEPMDSTLPEKIKPSTYHDERIESISKELGVIRALTEEEATERAKIEYTEEFERREKYNKNRRELKTKYLIMLEQVRAYKEPSEDHVGLKQFMESQILESMRFDCAEYEQPKLTVKTGKEWINSKLSSLLKDLEYHEKGKAEEIERTDKANLWIKQLVDSLN